jgi:glycosyltransferase EpsF
MPVREPIKVLQVIDTLGMGGAETWLMEALRIWSMSGVVQMDFLATSGSRGIFDEEAEKLGARIYYERYGRKHILRFARQFRRILRSGRYAAIHDHQDFASGWHFLLAGTALPSIRITHVHNPAYQIRNNYGVSVLRRLTAQIAKGLVRRYATHITGTSLQIIKEYGFDTREFRHVPKSALYCGFDTSRFNGDARTAKKSVCGEFGWPDDTKLILVVGRIDRSTDLGDPQTHKNSAFSVSVAIECLRRNPNIRALFAGAPSPAVPVLQQRIDAAAANGRIVFAGIRKDIERLMLAGDVLLFPSRGEGLGMACVEGQAAGLPVLASISVPKECVVVPKLVHFEDVAAGPDVWVNKLLIILEQARDVAAANRRTAGSRFDIRRSAQALLTLYKNGTLC